MENDIRSEAKERPITSIRFGDNDGDLVENGAYKVYICRDDAGELMMEDIDNLILALQKAKELWG